MKFRTLGCTGVEVSRIGLGTFNFGASTDEREARRIIECYISAGGNLIDTSNSYSFGLSEEIVGRAIKDISENVLVATKVGWPVGDGPNESGGSRLHIEKQCNKSLKRLGIEAIDLYQMHRPDPRTPIEETLRVLNYLHQVGKIRYTGTSTFAAWQVAEAWHTALRSGWLPFIAEQTPYNILDRRPETELFLCCQSYGIGVIAWSPLAGGILTGKYLQGESPPLGSRADRVRLFREHRMGPEMFSVVDKLKDLSLASGLALVQLAAAWALVHPAITSILIGPRTVEHLELMLRVPEIKLDSSLIQSIDDLVASGCYVSSFYDPSMPTSWKF